MFFGGAAYSLVLGAVGGNGGLHRLLTAEQDRGGQPQRSVALLTPLRSRRMPTPRGESFLKAICKSAGLRAERGPMPGGRAQRRELPWRGAGQAAGSAMEKEGADAAAGRAWLAAFASLRLFWERRLRVCLVRGLGRDAGPAPAWATGLAEAQRPPLEASKGGGWEGFRKGAAEARRRVCLGPRGSKRLRRLWRAQAAKDRQPPPAVDGRLGLDLPRVRSRGSLPEGNR